MSKGTLFKDSLIFKLKDPKFAAHYIQAAIEERDPEFFSQALGDVVRSHGIARMAEETGIARQALYRMLSEEGNPTLKNIHKILEQLGLILTVKSKKVS